MARMKRLVYVVLFNILISAATTLIVLYFWGKTHPPEQVQVTVVVMANPTLSPSQTEILTEALYNETEIPAPSVAETASLSSAAVTLIEYPVKKGDTLGKIALAFGVSLQDIMTANNLTDPDVITVGQILYIPSGPLPTATLSPSSTPGPTHTPQPGTSTPTRSPSPVVTGEPPTPRIESILGVGDLNSERVKITRTGQGDLSMAGWRLEDGGSNVFVFPNLILYAGGTVIIHTTSGLDTVTDLYWGHSQAVWQSGKIAVLRDAQGVEQARYQVP